MPDNITNEETPKDQLTLQSGNPGNQTTIEDPGTPPADDAPTPESLEISQAEFDKFFDKEKKEVNWPALAKERQFKLDQKAKAADPAPAQPAKIDIGDDKAAADAVAAAKLDMEALTTELAETKTLSEDTLKSLETVGISRSDALEYAQFKLTQAEARVEERMEFLGGDDGFKKLNDWAKKNLTAAELAHYNDKINGTQDWRIYAKDLLDRAGMQPGKPQDLIPGGGGASASSQATATPYANDAEMQKDIRDPKYKTDPNFRAQVMARAAATPVRRQPRQMA